MLRVRSSSRLCARIWGDACAPFFSYHIHLDVPWFVVVHRLLFRMPEGNQRAPERSTACFLATYFLHCTSYTFAFVNFLHFERAMIPSCFFHCQNVRARMSACPLATYSPSQISWLTSRLVPRSASESMSSSSCGYASHTAWRFRCERGFQQHQTRRPKTSKTSLGIVQRLLFVDKRDLTLHLIFTNKRLRQITYNGYDNINLEPNAMNNIDTVAHMNMHYTQY